MAYVVLPFFFFFCVDFDESRFLYFWALADCCAAVRLWCAKGRRKAGGRCARCVEVVVKRSEERFVVRRVGQVRVVAIVSQMNGLWEGE